MPSSRPTAMITASGRSWRKRPFPQRNMTALPCPPGNIWLPPLCTAAASDVPTVALDAGLTDQEVALITEADEGYILKFKSVELWQTLKAKLTK